MKKITLMLLMFLASYWCYSQTFTGSIGPIADNSCNASHDFPVTVTGVGVLGVSNSFSNVTFNITHTWDGDLDISLVAPDGVTIVELSTDNGGSGDNYTNTVISPDGATSIATGVAPFTGTYTPEGNLAVLNGLNADGTWILRVCDDAADDIGTLNSWSITFAPVILDLPDYANLQFPYTATINQGGSITVYGQVYEGGLTDVAPNISGQAPGIQAWVGYSTTDTNPNTWTNWTAATWNSAQVGNNDEYQANIGANLAVGTYYYATRFRLNGGAYVYGGTNFGFWNGTDRINGVLTVNPPLPPANDECSGALSLTVNPTEVCTASTSGTILGATASTVDAAACGGTEDDDVWFSFVATSTSHYINLNNVLGSTTDLYHSLWTGTDCSSLTLVPGTCSDPNNSIPTGLTIGQTYYLRVYSWTDITGQTSTFNVCIGTPPPPPANDNCTGAIALTVGGVFADNVVTGTTLSATTSTVALPACPTTVLTGNADVWYSVVVPASGNLTIETQASATNPIADTLIAAFSGTCGSLAPIGCDDDTGTGNYSLLSLTGQTAGSTLYIGVWKFGTTAPSLTVNGFRISAYDASLGSGSFDNANFSYYPNPIKNTLNLTYNQEISNAEVFNLLGQKVSSNVINANSAQIDMSNLSKGAYLVRVTSNNQVKTIKVIKE